MGLGPQEWEAIGLSLQVAFWATLVGLPLALGVAYLLSRKQFPGKIFVDALVHLPLVLPPVVTGYLLLLTFGLQGVVGSFLDGLGIRFAFHWTGAALAAGVMAFPLMVRPLRLGIEAVDTRLEEAATTLGAAPWQVFLSVTLPMIAPAALASFVLGFAKAMGEFGATITFVAAIPGETQTLPTAIYAFLQVPGGESTALRLVAVSVTIAIGAVIASEWLAQRMRRR